MNVSSIKDGSSRYIYVGDAKHKENNWKNLRKPKKSCHWKLKSNSKIK